MRRTSGFTLVEVLIVLAILGLLASIAVPGLLAARRQANEASAMASLRAIADGQEAFAATCAMGDYATRLPHLATPPRPGSTAFISPDLGGADTVEKSGYRVTLLRATDGMPGQRDACNGVSAAQLGTAYFATADPQVPGGTGDSHYWMGVGGVTFTDDAPIMSTDGRSPPPGAQPVEGGPSRRGDQPPLVVP